MPTYFTNLTKDYQEKEYMSTNKLRRGVQHIKISRVNDKDSKDCFKSLVQHVW